jgi:hypothetical protein
VPEESEKKEGLLAHEPNTSVTTHGVPFVDAHTLRAVIG